MRTERDFWNTYLKEEIKERGIVKYGSKEEWSRERRGRKFKFKNERDGGGEIKAGNHFFYHWERQNP